MAEPLKGILLSILEVGGYPNFRRNYETLGYQFVQLASMRKAIKYIKRNEIKVIVAEFNYQSDFRDRTSQLETLFATIQPKPDIKVIVFYERQQIHQLERLTSRFELLAALPYPIDVNELEKSIKQVK